MCVCDSGQFLRGEAPEIVDPEWVQWDVDIPAESDVEEGSEEGAESDDGGNWVPLLQPTRKRARVTQDDDDDDDDDETPEEQTEEESEEAVSTFPYPVGTWVARKFGEHGVFKGRITRHYPDDPNLCEVRFLDGDKEDLDKDETQYAVEYYQQQFGSADD